MTESSVKAGGIRIVFSPSSPLLKALVVILVVFSLVALAALSWVRLTVQSQIETMQAEAAAVSGRNRILTERMNDMDSDSTVRAIAKEELRLVEPKAVLIQVK